MGLKISGTTTKQLGSEENKKSKIVKKIELNKNTQWKHYKIL